MRRFRFHFRVHISLLLCCLVLLTGLAACKDKEKEFSLSDQQRPGVSVPGDLPEWLEVFRRNGSRGMRCFNASGYGIFTGRWLGLFPL